MKGAHLRLNAQQFMQGLVGPIMHPCVIAWKQGYRARSMYGHSLNANPYAPGDGTWTNPHADPDLYIEWSDGWNLAFAEAEARRRRSYDNGKRH